MFAETELELTRRLRNRDPSAFHRLVDRFGDRLYGLAYSLLGNAQDAEDVVQETFSGAFRSIGSFQQRSSLWTWLAKILVRQAARSRRSLASKQTRISLPIDDVPGEHVPATAPALTAVDARLDVAAAMSSLADDYRKIIVLRELQQMSYDEISQVLEIPLGTVQSRLYRARAELRQRLSPWMQ